MRLELKYYLKCFDTFRTLSFYDVLEEACQNMNEYTVRRTISFRYAKGQSLLKIIFNRARKDSKIKTWSFPKSDNNIDDPTGEIGRLNEKVFYILFKFFFFLFTENSTFNVSGLLLSSCKTLIMELIR